MVNVFYSFWKNKLFKIAIIFFFALNVLAEADDCFMCFLKDLGNDTDETNSDNPISNLFSEIDFTIGNEGDLNGNDVAWTIYSVASDKIKWAGAFNKSIKQTDGSYLVPIKGEKRDGTLQTYKKTGESIFYAHVYCSKDYVYGYLGFDYSSKKFKYKEKGGDGSPLATTRDFMCYEYNLHNEKFLTYGAYVDAQLRYNSLGWYPEKTSINDNKLKIQTFQYRMINKKFTKYSDNSMEIDCQANTVYADNQTFTNDARFRFVTNTACKNNTILVDNKFRYPEIPSNSNQDSGIDNTDLTDELNVDKLKEECRDLGFKEGTDKFGECVLQLLEKLD
jgi:hypothetical protein